MRRIFTLFLFAILLGGYTMAYDFSETSNGITLYYNITSSTSPYTVEIVPQTPFSPFYYSANPTGDFTIPSSVTYNGITYSVTSIGHRAFQNCRGLTSVTIPNSVTSIGETAFYYCNGLTSVTIPNSVTSIGESAFYGCSGLTSVTIPNSVTSIGDYAFSSCSGLTSLTIGNSITSIGESAFSSTAWYNNQPDGIVYLNNCCLGYKGNKPTGNLIIEEGTRCIAEFAFGGCNELTTVTIPNSVVNIGFNAFYNCSGLNEPVYNVNCFAYFPNGYATEYAIPDGIQQICASAFINCTNLTSVTIPNSVVSIDAQAFYGCGGLSGTLIIPNSVTSIGDFSFQNCSGLTFVTIPNSVTSIGIGAFSGCSGITEPLYNANCFAYFPSGYATEYAIPDGIYQIAGNAFHSCSELTYVTIPSSVTSIGYSAFTSCSGLTSITIPISVKSIGESAFYGCSGLTSVTIPNSVTSISQFAFGSCNGLSAITIPNSVTRIDEMAFAHCRGLSAVTIGNSVTSIDNAVFMNCSGLTDIYVNPATPPIVNSYLGGNNAATLWVPCEATTAYRSANVWSNFSDIREHFPYTIDVVSANSQHGNVNITQQPDCTNSGVAIITATPAEHYHFVSWNDGNTQNPRTITVESDSTFTANFAIDQFTVTVVSANETMGTVSGNGTFDYGTETQISATANEHYHFVSWNDGNTSNPRMITVESDTIFTATFAANEFTITVATETSRINSEPTFIPDGPNCTTQCYTSDITFSDFNEDAVVDNADAIKYVRLNMEHSFIGDLQIKITCPEDANHNRRSAIMLQDYYSSDSESDVFSGNAIDPYTYVWPDRVTSTRWHVGRSATNWYTGQHMIGRYEVFEDQNEAYTTGGYTYYLASFSSGTDAQDFITNYLSRYYSGREYAVYMIQDALYYVIGYTEGDEGYIVWLTRDNTTGDNAFSFPSQEAAQYFLNNVYGGDGVISSYSIDGSYRRISFGEPDYYDVRDANNITSGQICDDTDPHNLAGIGYDYAWTSNSQYNTIGYVYDSENIATPSIFYDNVVVSDTSLYHVKPSDVETGVQMYQPFQSFNNLVGCPLNGTWTISVCDNMAYDNGYVFDWEIAISGDGNNMGTVAGGGTYNEGEEISISATPAEHYHFVSWNDGNTENPRTITVESDTTFTATFAIDQFAVTVVSANESMGTVSGSGTYDYGTETQISAAPAEHYHFVSWNDGNTDNPCTIIVESNTTYTATFAANEFTITVATETSRINSEPTFIPDGPNCTTQCYTSDITFSDFNEDAVVENADAIKYVRLNMEHSFIGDLQIKITCPEDANHNRRSAIMLQDYYSNDPDNDLYNSFATDAYTYNWPYMTSTTYWHVGSSSTSYYTGKYMIGRTSNAQEGDTYTDNGRTYYFLTFPTDAEAWNYVHRYLERYFTGNEYTVSSVNSGEYFAISYTNVYIDSTWYCVWMTNDISSNGSDAYTFLTQEGAEYYVNTVLGGNGVVSSAYQSNIYHRVQFGEPDYYDVRDATNITTGQICDDTDPHNLAGIGYDYAWTSNSQYNTMGYVFDSENIAAPSIFYNNGVVSDTSYYHVMPSDVETGVQMYQPFQSFNNLVGCPLNGTWTISVCDSWAYDNGYVFDWEIAISGDGNNIGTVAGGGTYNEGEEISISATPAEHYHFVSWNDGNTENPRIVTVTEDATYSAIFAIDQHTIVVESADEAFGTVSGGGTYDYGTESQISATANEHYHFVRWNDGNTENPRTITVAGDVTYTATFAIDQFAVTVVSANESMGTVSGSGTYNYGTETQISATANEHYHFVQWNDGNTENPRTITVAEEATYTAEFTIDQHTITVVSSNETMGAVSGGGTFEYGIETQISAIPAEHHHFVSWNDGNTENPRTITVFADTTYTATFAVDVTKYTITAVSANPNYGTVTGGGTYAEGTEITLTAMPNEGYEFVQWNDESTENPRTITVTENAIYIATFAAATIPTIYNEFTAATCESYTWSDSIYTESGDYTQTFMAASSADSIVTLHLTIYPLPQPEITVDGILDACNPESASVSLSTGEYSAYNWSTGETSETITVTEIGNYYVEVVDGNGCHGVSEMATVGYSSVLTEAPQLKRVGMSNAGTNIVQWIVTDTTGVRGFEIYRENTEANVFELIGRVTNPRQRSWTDPTAEPAVRAYRYKICAVDECGGLSSLSDYHKTMHLTINRGMGTDWNLIWSHYEGFEYATYKIYRGTNTRDMIIIGQIPSTLNSFTDNTNTFEEGMFYKVEIVRTRNTKDGEEEEDIPLYSNIVANEFIENYTVTAVGNNVAYGTVAGGGTYPAGLDITLTALPNTGYEFVSWSDGSTENPRVITVSENAMYIATFEEIQSVEYTITVMSSNPNRGTVTGGGTYPTGTVITIEATAFEGYEFVSWSDENTENPRQITVTADATYIASFDPATGIEETSAFEIALFPDPATDILNITSSETISEIEIVNVMGQVVKRMEVNSDNAVCDVEDLTSGVYIVRISTASATLSQRKFIKE